MFRSLAFVSLVSLTGPLVAFADPICDPICNLTVAERFGIPRADEPVRMGIPLAHGAAGSANQLGLTDAAGKAIPCQFTAQMDWPDGTPRWVHLVFRATVAAKGKMVVKVVKAPAVAPPDNLAVTPGDNAYTVANGYLKLAVRGSRFNVIDSLAVDPTGKRAYGAPLIISHEGGIICDTDGKATRSSLDGDGKVVMEEQGPECVVLKATGVLSDGAGGKSMDYTCRIHVFAASPRIQVDVSYNNARGEVAADKQVVKSLAIVLPTTLEGVKFAIGGQDKVFRGDLAAGTSAGIAAVDSDKMVISAGGEQLGTAAGKSVKPLTVGWVDASNGSAGLGLGCRWFWQMYPRTLTVTGDGKLVAGLYDSAANGQPLDCYMGQGRTHYLTLLPHAESADAAVAEVMAEVMAAQQMPLRAVATPEYYCRTAAGFGPVADSDPAIYAPDLRPVLAQYDQVVRKSLTAIVNKIDGCTYQGVTRDSYGYNYWGDLFHWANKFGDNEAANCLWESNYYDFPFACILQFARTGDQEYLDVADRHALHLGDVFMCKWAPQKMYCGACRYSPPADEVGLDKAPSAFTPYFSVEFNHHKAQSMIFRYLLLGDLTSRDHFMLALNNALLNPEEDWRQCRGPGAKLATLYEGYQLTSDKACLAVMQRVMTKAEALKGTPEGFSKQGKSGYFMMGIAREGMLYWWQQTGDPEAVATVKSITDFLLTGGGGLQGAQDAYPLAFCFRQTGEQAYRDAAAKLLGKTLIEMRPKGFGMAWRSTPYAWYYLSDLGQKAGKN